MIGIVLVTHSRLGDEILLVLENIMGSQENIESVSFEFGSDLGKCREDIMNSITRVDTGRGVLVLSDIFGGTPSNLAVSLMAVDRVEIVSGVNLPMLVKLVSIRNSLSLKDLVLQAQEAGRRYISIASDLVKVN